MIVSGVCGCHLSTDEGVCWFSSIDYRPEADTPSAGGVSRRRPEAGKHSPAGGTLSVSVPASGLFDCYENSRLRS